MKKIGIFASLHEQQDREFVQEIISAASKAKEDIDVVVFYESPVKLDSLLQTSFVSFDNIWSFSGTLLSLSITKLYSVHNIPLAIKHVYVADNDKKFNPLSLLYLKNDCEIVCVNDETKNNLDRTIGTNRKVTKCESAKDILEVIT